MVNHAASDDTFHVQPLPFTFRAADESPPPDGTVCVGDAKL
jgi:hypothetical protein